MNEEQQGTGLCPPHHWLISNELTELGTVERWSCHRCGSVRERSVSRRRLVLDDNRRFVGTEVGDLVSVLGAAGERVA